MINQLLDRFPDKIAEKSWI